MQLQLLLAALLLSIPTALAAHRQQDASLQRRSIHARLSNDLAAQNLSERAFEGEFHTLEKRAPKACTKVSQCPKVTNGTPTCKSKKCGFTCKTGYRVDGAKCTLKCVSAASCPAPANSIPSCNTSTGICAFSCASGFKKSGSACLPSCSKASDCKVPPNSTAACKSGVCSFTCRSGFKLSAGQCLQTCKATSNCKAVTNANKPACKSGVCTFTCKTNFVLQNGACVTKPECSVLSDCKTAPADGFAQSCTAGKCIYDCYFGYDKQGNSCVLRQDVFTGTIRLQRWHSPTSLGYLSTSLNVWAQFGFYAQKQFAQGFTFTKTAFDSTGPYALKLAPVAFSYPSYQYFGGVTGWNSQDDTLGDGSFNYVVLTPTDLTSALESPSAVGSAYLEKSGHANKVESTIWYHNESTGQLTAQWINPVTSSVRTVDTNFMVLPSVPALIMTGDYAEFSRSYPEAIGVFLYFERN